VSKKAEIGRDGNRLELETRDQFDTLIDDALANYTAGEPAPGFTARIVATARFEDRPEPRLVRLGFLAAAGWVAAAALLFAWLVAHHGLQTNTPQPASAAPVVASATLAPSPAFPAQRLAHLAPPPRVATSLASVHRTQSAEAFHPIVFAPIVFAPISSEEAN
jgi:hypothetical protein